MTDTMIRLDEDNYDNYEHFGWKMYYRRQKIGISENMYQCMIREIEQYQIIKNYLIKHIYQYVVIVS